MDYSVDTPFGTYQEIQEAIRNKKAILSYQRSAAHHIACRVNQLNAALNLIIPLISVIAMLGACLIFSISKWVLLLGIATLILYTWVPYWRKGLLVVAVVLIILPLLVLNNAMWLLAIGVGFIGMIIGYDIWWGLIADIATNALMTNEALFQSVWTAGRVALKTNSTMDGFYVCGSHKGTNQ